MKRFYFILLATLLFCSNLVGQTYQISRDDCNINLTNIASNKVWYSFDLYQAVISYNPSNDVNQFAIGDNKRSGVFNKIQIVNFNTIPNIIDSFYSWKNDCINLHKGSGGNIDTTNIVYTKTNASLKSLNITGVNGSGHIHLRHQNTYPIHTGQSTTIFADSNGNMAWKNDGLHYSILNTSYQSANRTYTLQNKSYTLADSAIVYTKLTSTDTASLSNRINAINTNGLSYIDKATSGFSTITGVGSGISYSYEIPADIIKVGDIATADLFVDRTAGTGNMTIRFYINTSNSISGAILAGTANYTSTNLYAGLTRTFSVESSTVTNAFNASATASGDIPSSSTSAISALNIDWSVAQWIIIHISMAGTGSATAKMFRLYK
jgi:hypothetical protein